MDDIDGMLVNLGGYELPAPWGDLAELWELPGLNGAIRRLAATLQSIRDRRDYQTNFAVDQIRATQEALPGVGTDDLRTLAPFQWFSTAGIWGQRAWFAAGTLSITVNPMYGDTSCHLEGVELLAVSASGPGWTRYRGEWLDDCAGHLMRPVLARRMLREFTAVRHQPYWFDAQEDFLHCVRLDRETVPRQGRQVGLPRPLLGDLAARMGAE